MSLLVIPVNNTHANRRTPFLAETLVALRRTVDWTRHRLYLVDNDSETPDTFTLYDQYKDIACVIFLSENVGTARAVNRGWMMRNPGENCVKMDSDIRVLQTGWLDQLDDCVARDPKIGIIGLKRPDLQESPFEPPNTWSHSVLKMLPHVRGQRWRTVEVVQHVLGSCQLYSSALLDKIGYLVQFGLYGLDDSLAAARCQAAGFYNCFLCNVDIDHVDPGDSTYTSWKMQYAHSRIAKFGRYRDEYLAGKRDFYYGPDVDLDNDSQTPEAK